MNLSRRRLIQIAIVVAIIGLFLFGLSMLFDYLSLRKVTFNLSSNVQSVTLYDSSYGVQAKGKTTQPVTKTVATFTKTTDVTLKPGTYHLIVSGDKVSTDVITTEVKSDTTTIDVNPYYSGPYLEKTFSSEIPTINTVLHTTYSDVLKTYTIKTGTFYHFGDWYGTTMFNNSPNGREGVDTYGVILHKVDGVWKIAAKPAIVFSYADHTDIPKDVVNAVNRAANGY